MTFINSTGGSLSLDGGETWLPLESVSFESEDIQPDAVWEEFIDRCYSFTIAIPPTKHNLISSELISEKDGRWN